jgi:hypothetical protein
MLPSLTWRIEMRSPLQEKFQITAPGKINDGEGWATSASQRKDKSDVSTFNQTTSVAVDGEKYNIMPPGDEGSSQELAEFNQMPLVMSGASDVSMDTNPASFAEGFKRREMKGTDDQYTGEHVDLFYGDSGGFAERNNYLDRE